MFGPIFRFAHQIPKVSASVIDVSFDNYSLFYSQQLNLVIDYYSVDDLSRELHEWTFQLVKTNLQDM